MLHITNATYISEYKVLVCFNNGEQGIVDLENTIFSDHRLLVKELKSPEYFRSFFLNLDTISWPNGLDFAPEFLYENIIKAAKKPTINPTNQKAKI